MDYRKLLIKYISHVGRCEGITFLENHNVEVDEEFSKEELFELRTLEGEVK